MDKRKVIVSLTIAILFSFTSFYQVLSYEYDHEYDGYDAMDKHWYDGPKEKVNTEKK